MSQASAINKLEMPMISVPNIKHFPAKRIFDLLFSASVIILGAPVFIAIGLAIACTSRGPVLYWHERIGRGGRPFRCYKFRSMYRDADERLQQILDSDPAQKEEWLARRKLKKDPRISPLGALLRKTSLDEIPQFWNVIRGDLSVVGPRAVMRDEVVQYMGARAAKILSIRPGLTGLWQVSGRSNTSYSQRLDLDERYVDSRNLLLDLKLILKTVPAMLFPQGAY